MQFADLAATLDELEAAAADHDVLETLATLLDDADPELVPVLVRFVRGKVFARWEPTDLGVSSSLTVAAVERATGVDADRVEAWWTETGDLGDAAARAVAERTQQTLFSEGLTVLSVHETLREMATYEGGGSRDRRVDALAGLVSDADPEEARWLVRLVVGAMRVGVGEGTVRDAIALAFLAPAGTDPSDLDPGLVRAVERAYQVTTDFGLVARTARESGAEGLEDLDVELFRPVQSMLATKAEGPAGAVSTVVREGRNADGCGGEGGNETDDDAGVAGDGEVTSDDEVTADDGGVTTPDAGVTPDDAGVTTDVDRDVRTVEASLSRVQCEYKYDGVRVQIHVESDEVRLYTRRLSDVTESFPDAVDAVRAAVDADRVVLDGEFVAYEPRADESEQEGNPGSLKSRVPADPADRTTLPFQTLSQRIKRESEVRRLAREVPVVVHPFDAILVDDETLLDRPLRERLDRLDANTTDHEGRFERATRERPESLADLESFYEESLARGHEGLMVKNLEAAYSPGSRVGFVAKLKPTMEHLDLVVPRARWSEGRKSDYLGRISLACREEDGTLRDVGRLHSGLTDEQLATMTERLEPLVRERNGREVELEPRVVVEVAYEEIQTSTEYDSGFALRFPRFVDFRDDLAVEEVDTLDRVRALFEGQRAG